ncbi:MAG TPA: RNA pseudouridine synthase [Rhabdochlamydiaceae bacterium]|nr:RNA pseudouridine synthase [Rhabdochlamydiaceae bacterium]
MKSYDKEIYLDNHLLVLAKPHGIPTQPDFHEMAKAWLKKKIGKEGNVFLHPVHRLDKAAGGLVLFARSSKALPRLNRLLRDHQIQKSYLAKVEGILKEKEGRLEHFHFHDEFRAKISDYPFQDAKKASLSYKVIKTDGKNSLLEVRLHTGRYHQIRAQMAFIGHPIIGDKKYGSSFISKEGAIELDHIRLEFAHPVTQQHLIISLPS